MKESGMGPWSLNFHQIPFIAGANWGVYIKMNTGTSIGLGASSTMGFLIMKPDEVLPYKGE
jgi:hypothetical protein